MEKIGLNKYKDDDIKFFSKLNQNQTICINNSDINQISSIIIECQILNSNFVENINSLKIVLKVKIKIIYSTKDSNSLYVYDKSILSVQYILLPKSIDGVYTSNLFLQKKIKIDLFTENINAKILDESNVLINFYLIINIKINPSFYLGFIIDNGFCDNIFLSFSNGSNLTQKTFNKNINYSNLLFDQYSSNIAYLEQSSSADNTNQIGICEYKNTFNNSKVYKSINLYKNISDFLFINKNTVLTICDQNNIYTYNFKDESLKLLTNQNIGTKCSSLYFDKRNKCTYFLSSFDNINSLCLLDKKENFEVLFNFCNVIDYVVSLYSFDILMSIYKDKIPMLYTFNIQSKNLNPINLDFEYENILKIRFYEDGKFGQNILVLCVNKGKYYLLLHSLNTMVCKIIYENDIINDFDVDICNLDIFICVKSKNFSEIIKIQNNKFNKESILKISSNIKKIFIKRNTN